jgi:transcriptional regulator with XRE-family HTH domain
MPKPIGLPCDPDRMRDHRERAGLSLAALARRCAEIGRPVHSQSLGRVESGVRSPSPKMLRAIADALGVNPDALLDMSEDLPTAVGQ